MKKATFNILLAVISFAAFSQQRANNPLSRYGYGEVEDNNYALGDAMNGAVAGLRDAQHLNLANPASLTALDSMTFIFEVGLSSKNSTLKQGEQEQQAHNAGLDYLTFAFPIAKFWRTAAGVSPYSFSGYSFKVLDYNTPTSDSLEYTLQGSGGLSKVFWSNGFTPVKGLSIGLDASYVFGETYKYTKNRFFDYRNVSNTEKTDTVYTSGFIFSTGVQYEYRLSDKKIVSLGATFRPEQSLKYRGSGAVTTDGIQMRSYNYSDSITTMPQNYSIGATFQKEDHFLVSADFETTEWKGITAYGYGNFNNYSRVSLGGEYLPEKYSRNYLKRVKYRLGIKYEQMHWLATSSTGTVAEYTNMSATFGIGLPFKQTRNSLNLMAEVGRHNASEADALTDEYFIFKANITLFDKWFFKRKID